MVLTIILVPISSVSAETYTSKDNAIINSTYYEFFKSQFGEDKYYKFFAYDCLGSGSYSRTCYYGIDNDFNYVKISYNSNNELQITKGIDEDFSVSGVNVIEVKPSINVQIAYGFAFVFVCYIIYIMLGVIFL